MNKKKQGSLMFKDRKPTDPCQNCKVVQGTRKKHTCAYASEINGNIDYKCNCCSNCQNKCCEEI